MTKQEYFEFAEAFFNACIEISRKKNADYTGGDDNPFANFEAADPAWTGIGFFTRMNDKMGRIKSFIKKGKLQVEDESIYDTLNDLANYCCLFAGWIKSNTPGNSKSSDKPSTFIELVQQNYHSEAQGGLNFTEDFLDAAREHLDLPVAKNKQINDLLEKFIL